MVEINLTAIVTSILTGVAVAGIVAIGAVLVRLVRAVDRLGYRMETIEKALTRDEAKEERSRSDPR